MNQRMLARSQGGFTTCLVLRCDAVGKLTIANAGAFLPYVAGKELPLENGLPLGLTADTTYAERGFQLAPGDQLTLLTDGVVEARDKTGALFGFERSAALSAPTGRSHRQCSAGVWAGRRHNCTDPDLCSRTGHRLRSSPHAPRRQKKTSRLPGSQICFSLDCRRILYILSILTCTAILSFRNPMAGRCTCRSWSR